jgi:hypothetical protein
VAALDVGGASAPDGTGYCSARICDERSQPDVPPPDSDLPAPHHSHRIRERVGGADSHAYRSGRPVPPRVRSSVVSPEGAGAVFPRGGGSGPDAGGGADSDADVARDRDAGPTGQRTRAPGLAAAPARSGARAPPVPASTSGEHVAVGPDDGRACRGGDRRHPRAQRDRVLRAGARGADGGAGDRPLPAGIQPLVQHCPHGVAAGAGACRRRRADRPRRRTAAESAGSGGAARTGGRADVRGRGGAALRPARTRIPPRDSRGWRRWSRPPRRTGCADPGLRARAPRAPCARAGALRPRRSGAGIRH